MLKWKQKREDEDGGKQERRSICSDICTDMTVGKLTCNALVWVT